MDRLINASEDAMGRILETEVMESRQEAEAYDELDRHFGEVLFDGFALSASRMGVSEGRVLEVGTGSGRISTRLAALNPRLRIDAVDLSSNMLDLARKNAAARGVTERITFSSADAKNLPFDNGTFDLVICHNMLHQLPDPLVCLKEMVRVLKTNGAFLARDVRRVREPMMNMLLRFYCVGYSEGLRRLTYDSYRAGWTLADFATALESLGLAGARIRRNFITHITLERPAAHGHPAVRAGTVPTARSWAGRLLRWMYVSRQH